MKTFCCSRLSKGMGPIRIRVVCGDTQDSENINTENMEADALHEPMKARRGPKRKVLKPISIISPIPIAAPSADVALKSVRAAEVEE
jgi:hypothetical protein